MDENDPAWKLAAAAKAAAEGDVDAIGKAFADLKPTTEILAKAYAVCLTKQPFSGHEATRLLVVHSLQYALAEKTAHKLNVLTGWLVALTVFLVVFGVIDIGMRWGSCD